MSNKLSRISITLIACYLPFFLIASRDFFVYRGGGLISYLQQALYLLQGPLFLIIKDSNTFYGDDFNMITLAIVIAMLLALIIGSINISKSRVYQGIFALGALIWFAFGFITIGLFYITT